MQYGKLRLSKDREQEVSFGSGHGFKVLPDRAWPLGLETGKAIRLLIDSQVAASYPLKIEGSLHQAMDACTVCRNLQFNPDRKAESDGSIISGYKESLEASAQTCTSCSVIWEAVCAFEISVGPIHSTWTLLTDLGILEISYATVVDDKGTASYYRKRLQLYVTNESIPEWPALAQAQDVEVDTSSAESTAELRLWLENCWSTHSTCRKPANDQLPTRLLDVSNDQIKLTESPDENSRYVALSHCWGKHQIIRTLSTNLKDHKFAIPMDQLSKTFQDAVSVTRTLGVRYLWIDSLCIIQDSKQDWEQESALMAQVYGNSYITLLATASSDGRGGLFRKREKDAWKRQIRRKLSDRREVIVNVRRPLPHKAYSNFEIDLGDSNLPLLERSWCFQEYILSPRIAHFSEDEILWSCESSRGCTCGLASRLPEDKVLMKAQVARAIQSPSERRDDVYCGSSSRVHSLWWQLVSAYSTKLLTFDGDKLPAISGVAKFVQRFTGDRYLAGLWESHVADELFWGVTPASTLEDNVLTKKVACRPAQYRAPSWSWASVNANVDHVGLPPGSSDGWKSRVVEARCQPAGLDPTGAVSGGHIVVEGILLPAKAWRDEDEDLCYVRHVDQTPSMPDMFWEPDVRDECEVGEEDVMDVAVLWWLWETQNRAAALVLRPNDEADTFCRIGILQTDEVFAEEYDWDEIQAWLELAKPKTFKLI